MKTKILERKERGAEFGEYRERGECFLGFRESQRECYDMFEKIPGNVSEDSGEFSRSFRGMLSKIPGNL